MTAENLTSLSLGVSFALILYSIAKAMSKKPNRTMDYMNAHRAGIRYITRYSNDSGIYGEWEDPKDRLPDESEGEERHSNTNFSLS